MQGTLLKVVKLNSNRNGMVELQDDTSAAGNYQYSLTTNGKILTTQVADEEGENRDIISVFAKNRQYKACFLSSLFPLLFSPQLALSVIPVYIQSDRCRHSLIKNK